MTRASGPRRRRPAQETERAAYDSFGSQIEDLWRAAPPELGPDLWRATGPAPERPGEDPGATRRTDYDAIHCSREFAELRSRLRRFVFPMTVLFLGWYLVFVLLAAYAPGFMGLRVSGLVTVGMLLGLAQFVTTLAITLAYNVYARRKLDPQVELVRIQAGAVRS